MDALTKELHSFLVRMGYEGVEHEQEHMMEHLLRLLSPENEEAVIRYYGLFGEERWSLSELGRQWQMGDEDTMARIDQCLRRLAVTPEWQMMKENQAK